MRDNYWYLKNCSLFSRLSPEDIQELESESRMKQLKRGEPVYLPDQLADGILYVAQGRVKLGHSTPDGKQAILGFVDAGEIFGELSVLGGQRRDEYAETTEKTTLVLIPKQAFMRIMQKYPDIALGVTKIIGYRRQRIQRRLRNLLFRSNRERVIHLLLELAERYAVEVPEGLLLNIRLSHLEMASIIGSTRETVTVVLGQLQKDDFLTIARRKIILKDLVRLAAEVGEVAPNIQSDAGAADVDSPHGVQLSVS
jgi:CRP/FNR family transcriptional regulator, cyclic AMP receptor protein